MFKETSNLQEVEGGNAGSVKVTERSVETQELKCVVRWSEYMWGFECKACVKFWSGQEAMEGI